MEGARKLLREGKVPSIADAAEEAGVSRATAYRYFPTQGTLVREAVDEVAVRAGAWDEQFAGPGGLAERVERGMSQIGGLVRDNEALMRGSLLLSLQQWAKLQAGEDLGEEPIRRGGRLEGIDAALEPFKGKLDADTLRRLAIALAVVIGIESRVVMRDIWDLDEDEAEQMTRWMTKAFVTAAEAEGSPRSRSRR
jgi:AcrR family transcriptional regulator